MLILTLRAETMPQAEVTLAATCGAGCGTKLPLRAALASLPAGQWTTLGVPLKCYGAAGADVAKLERLLSVETDAALQLSFSQVALDALNEADHVLDCPKN